MLSVRKVRVLAADLGAAMTTTVAFSVPVIRKGCR